MKKKLLALLATFFLQTPVFAVLSEVTVLTKGNLTVYLYGDAHVESYARAHSIFLDLEQNRNWLSKLARLRARRKARRLEELLDRQVDNVTSRIARLAEQGESVTVMLEKFPKIPKSVVEGFRELSNSLQTLPDDSKPCAFCSATVHGQAKNKATRFIRQIDERTTASQILKERLPKTIPAICVDEARTKIDQFRTCIHLLEILNLFKIAGVDTTALEHEIKVVIGETSLYDLGIHNLSLSESINNVTCHDRDPLYPLIASVLEAKKRVMTLACRHDGGQGEEMAPILELLDQGCFPPYYHLELEAREKILAQENTQTPKKIMLFAGAFHTRVLNEMLKAKGFQVWYTSIQDDYSPEMFSQLWPLPPLSGGVRFDVLDTAKLEELAPRQARG